MSQTCFYINGPNRPCLARICACVKPPLIEHSLSLMWPLRLRQLPICLGDKGSRIKSFMIQIRFQQIQITMIQIFKSKWYCRFWFQSIFNLFFYSVKFNLFLIKIPSLCWLNGQKWSKLIKKVEIKWLLLINIDLIEFELFLIDFELFDQI